jgi:hypothetical protein
MTATLEKARLKDQRPADQSLPLDPPPYFEPPAEDLGTAAPPLNDFLFEAASANVDYDYGGRYGGFQPTCFNSTMVDDQEHDARADYNFHASRLVSSVPGYSASYSAPFYDPDAYGPGRHASSAAPPRESPAPQALDRMQLILEGIERATSASFLAIQMFVGQGELIL